MQVMATMSYPMKSTPEVGKAAVETYSKPLEHANRMSTHVTYGGGGIKAYSLFELEKGFEDEGMKSIISNYLAYGGIEGFKVDTEVVVPIAEAMSLIGLSL